MPRPRRYNAGYGRRSGPHSAEAAGLTSGHLMLRQLQLDALRLKSIDVSADDVAIAPLKKKAREISHYLDDLQQTFDEMRDTQTGE